MSKTKYWVTVGLLALVMVTACAPSSDPGEISTVDLSPTNAGVESTTSLPAPSPTEVSSDLEPGPYFDEIKAAANKTESEFQRDILEDGHITRAEYLAAIDRYVSCVEASGRHVLLTDQNGYYSIAISSEHQSTAEDDAAEFACAQDSTMYVSGLYAQTITDPAAEGYYTPIFRCAANMGILPPGYTEEDYMTDLHANVVTVEIGPDGPIDSPTTPVAPPPFPFDLNDPRYIACEQNPQNPVLPPTLTN